MLRTFLLLSGAALLAASTVVPQNQTATQTRQPSGASETVFQTRAGKVKVYLPDDMAAGDTISGTVVAEPAAAKDPKQEQKNANELSGYVLELGDNRTNTRDKHLHWKVPAKISAATIDLLLTDGRGKTLGRSSVAVAPSPSSSAANFQIPNLTQAGRPVQIQGPFDGNSANTSAKLGGADLPVLAESPRRAIFQNSQTSPGVLPVAINENGVPANGTTRNLQINLHAEKLDLLRGEQTELKVTVNGLAGLAEKLPIRLTNESPEIVTLAGGNVQTLETSGNSTNDKEEFSRTLTGIKPGKYSVTTEVAKPEPIADVKVQIGQPSTQPTTTTQPPSTQPSPTPSTTTPPTTTGTTPSTVRPTASPASTLPTSAAGPTGGTPSATASGMPAPSPSPTPAGPTIPNIPGPVKDAGAVPLPTPKRKENPCCQKIRDENGGGTRLIWRQGNNSFELKGNNLLLEIDGVRATWKFDRNVEEEFCYSARYKIASENKQVSETRLKDGQTTEKQETISLLFTGPDPGNQSSRQHKSFQFMASKLNNKAVKEYQVVLSVDEEKCTWMLSLFRGGELKEFLNRPPREPKDILDEMLRNLRRTHSGEQTYKHGDWWTNMYRMLGEIQQWLDWHPDEGQRDKTNEAYGAWRDNLKLALTNMQRHGTNVSSADKQTMNDLEKLLREDLPSREQLFEIRQKFTSLWEKFHESGAKF